MQSQRSATEAESTDQLSVILDAVGESHRREIERLALVHAERLRQSESSRLKVGDLLERKEGELAELAEKHGIEVGRLHGDLQASRDAVAEKTARLAALELHNSALEQHRRTLTQYADDLREQLRAATELDRTLAEEIRQLRQQLTDAEAGNGALRGQISAAQSTLQEKRAEITALSARAEALEQARAELEEDRRRIARESEALSVELNEARAAYRDERERARTDLAQAQQQLASTRRDLDRAAEALSVLEQSSKTTARQHASLVAALNERIITLQQESLRQHSAVVAADRSVERVRRTLSFQLGHALVMAGKSWRGAWRLPSILLDLRRQSRQGRFRSGGATSPDASRGAAPSPSPLAQEAANRFGRDGLAAAEQYLQKATAHSTSVELANAYTGLARLAAATALEDGCRLGREAVRLDPRPFRRKWLAFLLFDAGWISESHELLQSLPAEERLQPSERHKADRVAGCHRLLNGTIALAERSRTASPMDGPVLYAAASALPYHVSGYTRRTHSILAALRGLGKEVVCVTRPGYPDDRSDSQKTRDADSLEFDGVRYQSIPGPHRRKIALDEYFAESAALLTDKARSIGAIAIHAASNYENALPALMAARSLGVPFFYEVRGLWEYTTASRRPGWERTESFALDRKLETLVAVEADRVFTLTQALADELVRRGVDRGKIGLAPNGIDAELFAPRRKDAALACRLGLPDDAFVVGYVGSVLGYEGLDDLLAAAASLVPAVPGTRVLIVGDGDAIPSLRRQAEALGLADRVIFAGKVGSDEVLRYYSLLNVVTLPRKPYTVCQLVSPLKPLEAMAMALPLVVSDVAALKEMVRDGETAFVFPSGDAGALAKRLLAIATDPDSARRMAEAARSDVTSRLGWHEVVRSMAAHYPVPGCIGSAAVSTDQGYSTAPEFAVEPIHLPPGKNTMTPDEKAAFDARLAAALEMGGEPAISRLLDAQCSGRSARFSTFCRLKAANAFLAAGALEAAIASIERALTMDRAPATLRSAARAFSNAAQLHRAFQLAGELEAALDTVDEADARLIDELRGRWQLAQWAAQPPAPRRLPVQRRRVLNILAFSLPYTSVGYATRSHGLARGIRNSGWDVFPCTRPGFPFDFKPELAGQALPETDEIDGITYRRIFDTDRGGMKEVDYLRSSIDHYERLIEEVRPEVVHAASNYVTALPALIAARRQGIPFVYEIRGFWEVTRSSRDGAFENTAKYRFMRFFEDLLIRHSDRVLTITTPMKERLVAQGASAERIDIAFNSVDPARFLPRPPNRDLARSLSIPDGVPVIGYVGSFVDYEGLDDLISAAAGIKRSGHDFRLLMVGDGAVLDSLKTMAESLDVSDRVLFTGRVPHDAVEDYYSLVDIAPFPRKPWEVCELVSPLKPFEAMSQQKAVVVSSTRALGELVADGSTGLIFEKGQVGALEAALVRLIVDPGLRDAIGRSARAWVSAERSWDAAGLVCAAAYERAIEGMK